MQIFSLADGRYAITACAGDANVRSFLQQHDVVRMYSEAEVEEYAALARKITADCQRRSAARGDKRALAAVYERFNRV